MSKSQFNINKFKFKPTVTITKLKYNTKSTVGAKTGNVNSLVYKINCNMFIHYFFNQKSYFINK